jgi:hypothetical protein
VEEEVKMEGRLEINLPKPELAWSYAGGCAGSCWYWGGFAVATCVQSSGFSVGYEEEEVECQKYSSNERRN